LPRINGYICDIKKIAVILVFCALTIGLRAQDSARHWLDHSEEKNPARLTGVVVGASAIWLGSLVMLNELWYKNQPRSDFHSFDDSKQWLGVDKVGHGFTSYYIGTIGYHSLKWSGVSDKKAIWYGGTWGFACLTMVEVLDGFSSEYGFSWADMGANALGTGLFIGQQLAWGEQRILPKFSFHTTEFAKYRPEVLGSTFGEQLLKDYNGQTYWLSFNIKSFMKNKDRRFPGWLSVSAGYGGTGMIGGKGNPAVDDEGNPYPTFDRYSQFYLSLDVDLHRIKTKSRLVNGILTAVALIKVPLPTLEFNKHGVVFHPLYF
jgi:hypothetical protein